MLSKNYSIYYQETSSMLTRNITCTDKKFQVFYQRVSVAAAMLPFAIGTAATCFLTGVVDFAVVLGVCGANHFRYFLIRQVLAEVQHHLHAPSPTTRTSPIVTSIDSPLSSSIAPHSFIPSFSANPSQRSLPILLQD